MRAASSFETYPATDAEIASFIEEQEKIQGELASVKAQFAEFLQQQQANKLQYDFSTAGFGQVLVFGYF